MRPSFLISHFSILIFHFQIMSKRKKNITAGISQPVDKPGLITTSGHMPRPGSAPGVVVLTAPRRFGIDISDYTAAIKAAEAVDNPSRVRLFDLYTDIIMDTHLSSVIDKRINAVLCTEIEFTRVDGTTDDAITEQIRSPWFSRFVRDILEARFWGFSLCQFFRNGEWIDYNLIPRKHVAPESQIIKRYQYDSDGPSWSEYPGLVFIGRPDDLGLLSKAAPWVIYKRNTTGDWSQFSEVFGMPIQEYTYDSNDDDSRQRAITDARNAGSLAVFVHGEDTTLNLLEAGNKTGSADVYERLIERCNSEISKLILGNTLTTEASDTGTQALGTVHKRVEDTIAAADRQFVLDVLNYDMTDIFAELGFNLSGGRFSFPERKVLDDTTKANILVQLRQVFGLPVDDDYLYEEFGVRKPEQYNQLKEDIAALAEEDEEEDAPHGGDDTTKKSPRNALSSLLSFFGRAPRRGATDW